MIWHRGVMWSVDVESDGDVGGATSIHRDGACPANRKPLCSSERQRMLSSLRTTATQEE
jgi:hypothetical protein